MVLADSFIGRGFYGRSFNTALGHTEASSSEPLFRQHLLGGILYAAGIDVSPVSYLPFIQK